MIKEYLNVIDNETKEFLKKNVLHNLNFPYFLNHTEMDEGDSKVTNKNNDFCFFTHAVLHRPEKKFDNPINSDIYPFTVKLFDQLSKKCKFKYKKIFRISFNLTFNNGNEKSETHLDHHFPHKQLIVYLHVDDLDSDTCIYNKNKTKITKVKPMPYKVVIWNGLYHYHMVPKKGRRLILIYTFI
tara:strand:- start:78 stop:629 length:552 start_codon:yes stop_codon:yes gene_type:complete